MALFLSWHLKRVPDYQYYGEDIEFDTIYSQMNLAFGLSIPDGWQTKVKASPEVSGLLVTPLDIGNDDSLISKLAGEVEAKYTKEALWLIRDGKDGVSIQLRRLETTEGEWTVKVTVVTFIHHDKNELEELFMKLVD